MKYTQTQIWRNYFSVRKTKIYTCPFQPAFGPDAAFMFFTRSQTWIVSVVAGVISPVMTRHSASPTIISNYGILNWTVHGKTVLQNKCLRFIHAQLERALYRGCDKIGLHNIMLRFSHCNLTCTCACAHSLTLDRPRSQSRYS